VPLVARLRTGGASRSEAQAAPATGSIVVVPADQLVDGETVT
jgi:hypothetical protein